jgi:hypothetical protein
VAPDCSLRLGNSPENRGISHECLKVGQHIGGKALRRDLPVHLLNGAIGPHEVGDAVDAIVDLAHELFLAPRLVCFHHASRLIREKCVGKLVFVSEFLLLGDGVFAYPKYLHTKRFELGVLITEPATLNRSARGTGFGIEPDEYALAGEITEINGLTVLIR